MKLKEILLTYYGASGQSVNFQKSTLLFSENNKREMEDNLGFLMEIRRDVSAKKYLGIPVEWGRSKK